MNFVNTEECINMEKYIVAMSGGVDSSAAAMLLNNGENEVCGATLKLLPGAESADASDARKVCEKLGINFKLINYEAPFKELVIDKFISAYEKGETPNPCVFCNKSVKFRAMLDYADSIGFNKIATGHYVKIKSCSGRRLIYKAEDSSKDQSYVLYTLTQDMLKRIEFPLAELSKGEIRELAAKAGLTVSSKKDSQDICFVPNGKYAEVIEKYTNKSYPCGNFIDESGNVLGEHKGIIRYTIGQRRGLGLALPASMYVKSKDVKSNTVTLCFNESLYSKELFAKDYNFIAFDSLNSPLKCTAKTRYKSNFAACTVYPDNGSGLYSYTIRNTSATLQA